MCLRKNVFTDIGSFYTGTIGSPERRLLLGVLFRAVLDLEQHATPLDRKHAIRWFRSKKEYSPNGITFQQVVDEFGLANWCLGKLEIKIREAEIYENQRRAEAKRQGATISMFHPIRRSLNHIVTNRVARRSLLRIAS